MGAIHAQPAAKVWRIGLLFPVEPRANRGWQSFEQGLRDLGYIEERNETFDYEFGHGEIGQPFADARNLVRLKVDLIVTLGSGAVAAKEATTTTPIVALAMADAVESGLVASLARPGGNITGMSLPYSELAAKRLEMLKAALPHLQRVALLTTGSRVGKENELRAMTSAARSLGLKLGGEATSTPLHRTPPPRAPLPPAIQAPPPRAGFPLEPQAQSCPLRAVAIRCALMPSVVLRPA